MWHLSLMDRMVVQERRLGGRTVRAQATDREGQNSSGNDEAFPMAQHSGA